MKNGKREARLIAKRAQIISVAREHFLKWGYDGTVMSAIAAQLGGSKRTLWAHFSCKETLFTEVVEEIASANRGEIEFSAIGLSPLEKMTNISRIVIEHNNAPVAIELFRLIAPHASRHPELSRIWLECGPERTIAAVADYLQENFAELLWTSDFKTAAQDLVALATSSFQSECASDVNGPPTIAQTEEWARRAALLFLRAYANEPERWAPIEEFGTRKSALIG